MLRLVIIVVSAFIIRKVSQNSCAPWQWPYWIKLFSAITLHLRRCKDCWATKMRMSCVVGFGNAVFARDIYGKECSWSRSCLSLSIMSLTFSDCRHHSLLFLFCLLSLHTVCIYEPGSFHQFFPCWLVVSGKPRHLALIVYSRVSQPVGHGRIFDGSRPGIIEIE